MSRRRRPAAERVWDYIDVRDPDGCWPWTAARDEHGYGRIDNTRATRILLGLASGNPLFARHTCDNPPCCNPAHLVPGTHVQNMADMKERGRSPRGEKRPNAKLSAAVIDAIRRDPRPCRSIADDFGTSADLIVKIKRGERWGHVQITGPVALPTRHRYGYLTDHQQYVLRLVEVGLTAGEIGLRLNITEGTVRTHLQRIYRKLGVSGRHEAVTVAYERGLMVGEAA